MIYIYVSPSCQSCRKAIKWFNEQKIEYKAINILNGELTKEDIFRMLSNSFNGFEDIISTRSKPYLESGIDFDEIKTSELIDFILKNPTILKRPIIVAPNIMEVGYNADDIEAFIPRERRNINAYCESCDDTEKKTCDHKDEITMLLNEMREAVKGS